MVTLSGQHVRRHEDMAIAECEDPLTLAERHDLLQQINIHVTQVLHQQLNIRALTLSQRIYMKISGHLGLEVALRVPNHEVSSEAAPKEATPPVTIVYKRRRRAMEANPPPKENEATPRMQKT
ncbi:hypothetical protein GUJ93_ZPchr0007g5637 [Zizania palustris]|uniref:DUF7597 domain-containing protein n=1 Tax=Zizania palustris TaxID=103762 RepID=A0A8J5SUH4_ZIZPA|nr:hypothetical protein GUJ93_ZPchr0007g5637 [Zizania palustris]